ncbi:UNVERIFIED_CONTAM: Long-chain-fatty-acid--CoA ligase 4 [Trichonephila clavipes]
MDELFRLAIVRHGSKKCVGTREVLSEADEYLKNGKVFKKVRLGDKYIWHSYIDINERIETLAKGLLSYGLQPKKQIAIFAETRIEWMLACQACFRINVPAYHLELNYTNNNLCMKAEQLGYMQFCTLKLQVMMVCTSTYSKNFLNFTGDWIKDSILRSLS